MTAERTKAFDVHLIKSGHLERLVGCAVVGLTRRNDEGGLMVDYFPMKIGRPLHRTLRRVREAVLYAIRRTPNSPTRVITLPTHKIAKDRGTYKGTRSAPHKIKPPRAPGGLRGRGSDKAK